MVTKTETQERYGDVELRNGMRQLFRRFHGQRMKAFAAIALMDGPAQPVLSGFMAGGRIPPTARTRLVLALAELGILRLKGER